MHSQILKDKKKKEEEGNHEESILPDPLSLISL